MDRSWLWDRKISAAKIKSIFKNESHPRFAEFAALLLARKNTPKEVFKDYFSTLVFCRNWPKIKKSMRRDSWNNPRIEFWQAVYERLAQKYKNKKIALKPIDAEPPVANELAGEMAQKIIAMRKQKGFTQQDLARRSGFSQQMISRIEKGRQNISLSTLKKIADSLECRVGLDLHI
ncbi:MAG: helix-turn-helix transcriptional regulator [Candidatus Omnitrophota bacterium]|nr:helix-turn-helix transcriptional regulator [Candidatus Omnitrophota bacterium]